MEHEFWRARWEGGQTGFHLSAPNPVLVEHFAQVVERAAPDAAPRVLVPLCGKSVDLTWLQEQGCEVLGVEFVEQAAQEYFAGQRVEQRSHSDSLRSLRAGRVEIVVGDFLAVEPGEAVDVIYDRAALVAIAPEHRKEYMARLVRWLRPGGQLLLASFNHDAGSGPPFSVPETEHLLSAHFTFELLSERDVLAAEPRFRERGASFFQERVFLAQLKPTA